MAGVAPQRGGSNATTVGMVVAIVVAALLGGVLIWLSTMQEELRTSAEQARTALSKMTKGADEAEAKKLFPAIQSGSGKTVVGEMVRSGQALVGRLTGDQTDSSQTAIGKLDAAIAKITADAGDDNAARLKSANGAVAIIESLHELYSSEREARMKAEKASQRALDGLAKAEDTNKKLDEKFKDALAKLNTQVESLQKSKSDFESEKRAEIDALASKVESTRNALEENRVAHAKEKRRIASTLRDQDEMLAAQTDALKQFRHVPTNAEPMAIARKAVGKILRILPGDSLCYINLGRDDRVTLGMTFSVYSGDQRIPADGRGKATLEVKSVDSRTAECRIVAAPSPDDPIIVGDSVNNIILSQNRTKKQRFVVVGEFDTDFDGEADVRGREQIVAWIERLGGEVTDEVTAMTDYVVLGVPPRGQDVAAETSGPMMDAGDDAGADEQAKADADEEESSDDKESKADDDDESGDDDDEKEAGDDDDGDSGDDEGDSGDDEGDDEGDDGDGGFGGDGGPAAPTIERNPEVDPTIPALKIRYKNEADRYRDAKRRASYFSIPTLTQDQFYNFVGIEGKLSDIRRLQG